MYSSSTRKKFLYSRPFQALLCTPLHKDVVYCFDMTSDPLVYDKSQFAFKSKVVFKNEVYVLI